MVDLGRLGEAQFSSWCAELGLIANESSKNDGAGWDHIVEFPYLSNSNPFDIHKSPVKCKVQVKSTAGNKSSVQMNLSNLRWLACDPYPAFILFFKFDNFNQVEKAYVRHLDSDFIEKILMRIREVGGDAGLNKKFMNVYFDNSNLLPRPDSSSFSKKVFDSVGADLNNYVLEKNNTLSTVGFEDGVANLKLVTDSEESFQDLIDVSIGAKQFVTLAEIKGVYKRFRIEDKEPFIDAKSAVLEMVDLSPTSLGVVRFKEDNFSPSLSFPSRLYISPFASALPSEMARIRIDSDFFEILMSLHSGEVTINFKFEEGVKASLRQHVEALELFKIYFSSGKELICEMEFEGYEKISFKFFCGVNEFEYEKELDTLRKAMWLVDFFQIDNSVIVNLKDVFRVSKKIEVMEGLLSSKCLLRIEFDSSDIEVEEEKPVAFVRAAGVHIGDHILGVVVVAKSNFLEVDEGRFRLLASEYFIERKLVVDVAFEKNDDFKKIIDSVADKYSSEFFVLRDYS